MEPLKYFVYVLISLACLGGWAGCNTGGDGPSPEDAGADAPRRVDAVDVLMDVRGEDVPLTDLNPEDIPPDLNPEDIPPDLSKDLPLDAPWDIPNDVQDDSDIPEDIEPPPEDSWEIYIPDICAIDCEGKECGDDGCGGSCGTCPFSLECVDGQCVPAQLCPTAVIQCVEGDEVIPQTVLHLYGDQSYAVTGTIAAWSWSVDQPPGSQSVFVPSASFPNPTFEVNTAGVYHFELVVYDEQGVPSCAPDMFEVVVVPEAAIHVELLWHTPEDPDETDQGPEAGADLDLHFVHPWAGGPDLDGDGEPDGWFDQPFDCFWFNAHPNWGSFDPSVDDDPGMDLDDTDGAGPENINLGIPEDVTYRVGVHYWNDHGYGASYATVRVYISSLLAFEVTGVQLVDKDMWEVCTIEWPSGQVTPVLGDGGGYKITPDYQNPFFFGD